MNPTRSLAPAIASGNMEYLWLYTLAPMAGAVGAAIVYRWLRGGTQNISA